MTCPFPAAVRWTGLLCAKWRGVTAWVIFFQATQCHGNKMVALTIASNCKKNNQCGWNTNADQFGWNTNADRQ
jgi:hypothetical protein